MIFSSSLLWYVVVGLAMDSILSGSADSCERSRQRWVLLFFALVCLLPNNHIVEYSANLQTKCPTLASVSPFLSCSWNPLRSQRPSRPSTSAPRRIPYLSC